MSVSTPVRPVGLDTVEQAAAALEQIVAGRETYVYDKERFNGCMNIDPESKCGRCLIGTLLLAHGVPVEMFDRQVIEDAAWNANFAAVSELVEYGLLDLPEPVVEILSVAQGQQDDMEPWGRAVSVARSHAASLDLLPA